MAISAEAVKELRDRTGVSVMQCKKALEEGNGDVEKAIQVLSRKSADVARKKADRDLLAGAVASYVHNTGQIGTLVLLSCETDFVSKNEEFTKLAYDIAMHAAATRPQYVRREEMTEAELASLREVFLPEVAGKPENLQEQILTGKIANRLKEIVLLDQPFIKDDSKTIAELLTNASQKFGERIEISKLSCFSVRG